MKGYGATVNFLSLVVNPGSMVHTLDFLFLWLSLLNPFSGVPFALLAHKKMLQVIPCKPIVADRETTKDKVSVQPLD